MASKASRNECMEGESGCEGDMGTNNISNPPSTSCAGKKEPEGVEEPIAHEVFYEEKSECITISEDGEVRVPPKELVCLRCPNNQGTFTDLEAFWHHVDRHKWTDHYSCKSCKRPFTKLSHCISHEYRVHQTPIPKFYDDDSDPVILMAKDHVKGLALQEEGASSSLRDMDPEDVTFYDNIVVPGGSYYPYRGPPVEHIVQTYEIELYKKQKTTESMESAAKAAIFYHKENVRMGLDEYKLGKFRGPREFNGSATSTYGSSGDSLNRNTKAATSGSKSEMEASKLFKISENSRVSAFSEED